MLRFLRQIIFPLILLTILIYTLNYTPTPSPPPVVAPLPITTILPVVSPTKLIVFSADWCGACQQAKKQVNDIEKTGVIVTRYNADVDTQQMKDYNVHSLPTYILFYGKKRIETQDINTVIRELKNDR